jgi:uncharacterized protein with NAD-binding domain and iron-sulfur cluster
MSATVAVLGGGIGGLSAAHELAERGFDVTVYEANERFGGKARSIPVSEPTNENESLLGEHGFRFFPGFYRHVTDTMRRIPYKNNQHGVYDNLRSTTESLVTGFTDEQIVSTETPRSPQEWIETVQPNIAGNELSLNEARFFAGRLLTLLTSCEERREDEFDDVSWWDFIDAETMSDTYKKSLGHGTQLLVALHPQDGSARTVGQIYLQLLRGQLDPSIEAERVLNGPTSHVWIDPWTTYLDDLGVELHAETPVQAMHADGTRITGVTIETRGSSREIQADYYVAALPVETMVTLLTKDFRRAVPSLARVDRIDTGWMSGLQFYLTEDASLVHGHGIYLDSPWALTSISQRQFWDEYDLSAHSDNVAGVLSVIISDWNTDGIVHGKPARDCSPQEIKEETWAQLKTYLNQEPNNRLTDDMLHDWFLNPDIKATDDGVVNKAPLLVNTAGSLRSRPDAATNADNLVLAADYVRTNTDLASMEGANEAARRAVNAIIKRTGATVEPCDVWELEEPAIFDPLKAQDAIRYRLGLPHPGEISKGVERTIQQLTAQTD